MGVGEVLVVSGHECVRGNEQLYVYKEVNPILSLISLLGVLAEKMFRAMGEGISEFW